MNQNPQKKQEQSSDSLYLNQLKFTKKERQTFMNYFINHFRVVILVIISVFVWGIFSFLQLPLESNPEVEIPFGIVTVSLPGASPSDVEELIIKEIEDEIVNIEGVKTVSSSALNSFASITVEFQANEDLDDAIRRLRDTVDSASGGLPDQANDPIVSEVSFSSSPIWTMVITGPYDNFTLREYAELVQDELLKLPGTSEVLISGGDREEIRISINPNKLTTYGVTTDQVLNAIRSNDVNLPLGTVDISNFEYSLSIENDYQNVQDIRRLPIKSTEDQIIRVQDVASVVERATENQVINRFSVEGNPPENAITINLVKKTGASIIDLIDSGKAAIEELKQSELPSNIKIETTLDEADFIRDDYFGLRRDALITIALVTIVLFLFVGLKEALVAGLSIPIVFAATFGLMYAAGLTINFLSLFSLILALGLLVDDAIVVVQATKQYLRTGRFTPEQAVLLVFRDFKFLILTTSLTTIFAFVPLLLATGIIGEFIKSIPLTVTMTLISSTLTAIFINHPMAAFFERTRFTLGYFKTIVGLFILAFLIVLISALSSPGLIPLIALFILGFIIFSLLFWYRKSLKDKLLNNEQLMLEETASNAKIKARIRQKYLSPESQKSAWSKWTQGVVKLDNILPYYEKVLRKILNSRFVTAFVLIFTSLIFAGALYLPASGILKSEFIPPADYEIMFVNIEGPPGMILQETEKVVTEVEEVLLDEPNIKTYSVVIGSSGVNLSDGTGGGGSSNAGQTNRAQFSINLYPESERPNPIKSYNYAPQLRNKLADIDGAEIEVVEISGGPPTGADFSVSFLGDDLLELERIANNFKAKISEIEGTVNENISLTLTPGEFTFKLKPEQLQIHGITAQQVASTLRTAISSSEITSLLRNEDEIDIVAEFSDQSINSVDALRNLKLINNLGQPITIGDVADIEIGSSIQTIRRQDERRVITLSAGVESPTLPGEVYQEFQSMLDENPLPEGYEVSVGGQQESNQESILSILRAMIVAFILIVSTMVIQFNSFRRAVLVLATIPLAMTGVFYGLTIAGFTLSFPALIGILALFGIVVKNAIILIEKIRQNEKVGIKFQESIIDASKSRLEAIFLTSASTIIGMIPITLNNETWEGLGASLVFGLSSSTLLTLLVIPTLYNLLFKKSDAKEQKIRKLKEKALKRA
ncbi:MMPL family transporter [Candidatus Peregrinibacteria bacterium]|nr:MMPL family transporter [Candidatus Peregrinibacteria bacterium]